MRTLKLRFPDDALCTLDTCLQQTKEARGLRRAQAVREIVKGQRLQTVSDTLAFTYAALRKGVHRFAHQGTPGLMAPPAPVDRRKSPVSWHSTASAWSSQTPWSTALAIPNGVAASGRPSSPVKPGSTSAAQGSVVS